MCLFCVMEKGKIPLGGEPMKYDLPDVDDLIFSDEDYYISER